MGYIFQVRFELDIVRLTLRATGVGRTLLPSYYGCIMVDEIDECVSFLNTSHSVSIKEIDTLIAKLVEGKQKIEEELSK